MFFITLTVKSNSVNNTTIKHSSELDIISPSSRLYKSFLHEQTARSAHCRTSCTLYNLPSMFLYSRQRLRSTYIEQNGRHGRE